MTVIFTTLFLVPGPAELNLPQHDLVHWTEEDQAAAEREGWCLFEIGGGLWELQRDDDSEAFWNDDEALRVVAERATLPYAASQRNGAPPSLHARALALHYASVCLRLAATNQPARRAR
jgi:hypothetical protein